MPFIFLSAAALYGGFDGDFLILAVGFKGQNFVLFEYTPGSAGRRLFDYIGYENGRFLPKNRSRQTTPVIKDLLRRQRIKTTAPLMQTVPYGQVALEPHSTGLSFRIERSSSNSAPPSGIRRSGEKVSV